MNNAQIGPWPTGIDMVSTDTSLVKGACRSAENVWLSREGFPSRRKGYTRAAPLAGAGLIWTSRWGKTYVTTSDCVYLFDAPTESLVSLGTLKDSGKTLLDLLDYSVVCTSSGVFKITDTVTPLALPTPGAPQAVVRASGGLPAGRYGIAHSYLRGEEEGGVSAVSFVDVPEGGGMTLSVQQPSEPGVTAVRTYRTTQNGDVLYRAADTPTGMTSYVLGNGTLGRQADTVGLAPIPGGHIARHMFGRLFVARGKTLYFSEPMRYGLYDMRHGFIQFPHRITMLELLSDGIYVGNAAGAFYMDGGDPNKWQRQQVSGWPPVLGSGTTIEATELSEELQKVVQGACAVWLTEKGYVLGVGRGQIISPQSTRISISPAKVGATVVHQRRIITTEVL